MSEPKWKRNLSKFAKSDPVEQDIASIDEEMYNGPDRGAVLVLTALVERALEKLLRNNLREDGVSELFGFNGSLGTLNSKIEMAYAMKLFGPDTRRELDIIRNLRNQFAHSIKAITFDTPAVKACCDRLIYPDLPGVFVSFRYLDKVCDERLQQARDKTHPRTRFFVSCSEITQRIYFFRTGDHDDPINHLL